MQSVSSLINNFPAKLLQEADFVQFLEAASHSCIQYVEDSNEGLIRETYLSHIRESEDAYNKNHDKALQNTLEEFETDEKNKTLYSLDQKLYMQKKVRHLYVAEQRLLYKEFHAAISRCCHCSLPLKQLDGQFTRDRLLHLLEAQYGPTTDDRKMILDEKNDTRLIRQILNPREKAYTPVFSEFAKRAIEYLNQAKGTTPGIHCARSLIAYVSALKALKQEGIKKIKDQCKMVEQPPLSLSAFSLQELHQVCYLTQQKVSCLSQLLQLSMPSESGEAANALDKPAATFFEHVQKCKIALHDLIERLEHMQEAKKQTLCKGMAKLQLSDTENEPSSDMDVFDPIESYLSIFKITNQIFNAISGFYSL
ncbi:MAG: hypothetical protein JSR46_10425 [Verrucomicrobia bacterium]|nr:hypothetical protein [Verrucomicrobiota bacterium]